MEHFNLRVVVAATDLGENSDRLVRTAAAIAALTDAELHLVHVHVVAERHLAEAEQVSQDDGDAMAVAERELESQARRAVPANFSIAASSVIVGSAPSEALRQYTEEVSADLIVIGPHRGEAAEYPVLGTTADRLVRTAKVPCLIVRESLTFPVRRMGVFVDFSPGAQAAVETASAWATAFAGGPSAGPANVSVVHVAESDAAAEADNRLQTEVKRTIDRVMQNGEDEREIEYTPEVLYADDPAAEAARWVQSEELQLIVLGTRGISRLPYSYLGGFASTMARSVPCSVLLVPPEYALAETRAEDSGSPRFRRIVTGIDFHESSWEAAVWAMRYFAPDAEHELIHVIDVPDLPGPLRGLGGTREQLRLSARSSALRRLAELRDLALCPFVRAHVQEGKPAMEITRLASEIGADLIVVGEQGPRRGVAALLGSTAERVLFDSPTPVLLARKVADTPPRHIVVAVDTSPMSKRVLIWGASLAERFNATVTILNVVNRLLLVDDLTALPSADAFQQLVQEATAAMETWVDEQSKKAGFPQSRTASKVVVGDPSYEIVSEAGRSGADLVLIGSSGGDVARTPLIGRIVNKVVRTAPCSVLVVTSEHPRKEGAFGFA